MSSQHYKNVFKVYVSSLASILHHDMIKGIKKLDSVDTPGLYINRLKTYANALNTQQNLVNEFIKLYSDMYDSYIKKESNKLRKVKEFVNSWYPVTATNNIIINNNYMSLIAKVNVGAIKILLSDYFITNAKLHIQMFLRSHDDKYHNEVRAFEHKFTMVVNDAVKLSCSKIKNNITEDYDTMVPASQYISVMRELEKLKRENNSNLVEELRAEIEELKNEIEMLKITSARV